MKTLSYYDVLISETDHYSKQSKQWIHYTWLAAVPEAIDGIPLFELSSEEWIKDWRGLPILKRTYRPINYDAWGKILEIFGNAEHPGLALIKRIDDKVLKIRENHKYTLKFHKKGECKWCGTIFLWDHGEGHKVKYCCNGCRDQYLNWLKKEKRGKNPVEQICIVCGKSFMPKRNSTICSNACKQKHYRLRSCLAKKLIDLQALSNRYLQHSQTNYVFSR